MTDNAIVESAQNSVPQSDSGVTVLEEQRRLFTRPSSVFDMTTDQFDRVKLMAQMYAQSQFAARGNEKAISYNDAFLIMMKGIELGLTPMAAIEFIYIIGGKPAVDGKGMLALIRKSPLSMYVNVVESTDTRCEMHSRRTDGGEEGVFVWTMARAQKYKIYKKGSWVPLASQGQWQSQPKIMLFWRTVAEMARAMYSDVIGGLYTKEELVESVVAEDGTMTPVAETPALNAPQQTPPAVALPEQTQSPAHWAEDAERRQKFIDLLISSGMGETAGEAWAYFAQHYDEGKPLAKATDLPNDPTAVNRRVKEIAAELAMSVGADTQKTDAPPSADKSLQGDTLSEKESEWLDTKRWLDETLGKTLAEVNAVLGKPLNQYPSFEAAVQALLTAAIAEDWQITAQKVEYTSKKHLIFHLADGVAYTDEKGKPVPIMAFGGRSKIKDTLGAAYYLNNDVDQWQPGSTHDIEPVMLNVELKHNTDGVPRLDVTALSANN